MTISGFVGPNLLPVSAGSLNSDLQDTSAAGLADYLRFWIRDSLNTKLTNIMGTSADAVPSANVHLYNPGAGGVWVRNALPSLYVWFSDRAQAVQATLVYRHVQRELSCLWIFDELVAPGDDDARSGISAIVAQTFLKAAERGRHESYAYGSDPLGMPIWRSLSWINFECQQAMPEILWNVPGGSSTGTGRGDGAIQRGFPAVRAKFQIVERIYEDQVSDTDSLIDASLAIHASDGEDSQTMDFMDRELTGPDGSEEL